jgi:pimeloyl-ACP methyl ester carboxylesterase
MVGPIKDTALPVLLSNPVTRTAMLTLFFARPWRKSPADAIADVQMLVGAANFDAALAEFRNYVFHDAEQLRDVPVTVAWGDRDYLLLFRQAARARRVMPWAHHVTLEGCGHAPFSDDAELLVRVLSEGARAAPVTAPRVATEA